jgi:hypothetical protein
VQHGQQAKTTYCLIQERPNIGVVTGKELGIRFQSRNCAAQRSLSLPWSSSGPLGAILLEKPVMHMLDWAADVFSLILMHVECVMERLLNFLQVLTVIFDRRLPIHSTHVQKEKPIQAFNAAWKEQACETVHFLEAEEKNVVQIPENQGQHYPTDKLLKRGNCSVALRFF